MQCPSCHSDVPGSGGKYCPNCGARLRPSAVPTVLGCGLSALLGLLGLVIIVVCGAMVFLATCAYGLSNNSGPSPNLVPYEMGGAVGALLLVSALGLLVYSAVAKWRGAGASASNMSPPDAMPSQAPLQTQHTWAASQRTEESSMTTTDDNEPH